MAQVIRSSNNALPFARAHTMTINPNRTNFVATLATILAMVPGFFAGCSNQESRVVRFQTIVARYTETGVDFETGTRPDRALALAEDGSFSDLQPMASGDGWTLLTDEENALYVSNGIGWVVSRRPGFFLETTELGRAEVAIANVNTSLAVNIPMMRPFSNTDTIVLECPSFGLVSAPFGIDSGIGVGAESAALDFDWAGWPLLSEQHGDKCWLWRTEQIPCPSSFICKTHVDRSSDPFNQSMQDGGAYNYDVAFETAPTLTLSVEWHGQQFVELAPSNVPGSSRATIRVQDLFLWPFTGRDFEISFASFSAILFDRWNETIGMTADAGLDQTRNHLIIGVLSGSRIIATDGTHSVTTEVIVATQLEPQLPFIVLKPDSRASAPPSVSVDGCISGPCTLTHETPLIEWEDVGATVYHVVVKEFLTPESTKAVAVLATEANDLRIPPGLLKAQGEYYFQVVSVFSDQVDKASPLALRVPFTAVDAVSPLCLRK